MRIAAIFSVCSALLLGACAGTVDNAGVAAGTTAPASTLAVSSSPPASITPAPLIGDGVVTATGVGRVRWLHLPLEVPERVGGRLPIAGAPVPGGLAIVESFPTLRMIRCLEGAECVSSVPALGADPSVFGIRAVAGHLWMYGEQSGSPTVWSSSDGTDWETHPLPRDASANGAGVVAVVGDDDGMLVLAQKMAGPTTSPTVPSPDFQWIEAWILEADRFTAIEDPHPCLFEAAVAATVSAGFETMVIDDAGFLGGVPAGPMSPSGPGATRLYRSTDGITWAEAESQPAVGLHIDDLQWTGSAYFAEAAADPSDLSTKAMWVSNDLVAWTGAGVDADHIVASDCGPAGCAVLTVSNGLLAVWLSPDVLVWTDPVIIKELGAGEQPFGWDVVIGDGAVAVWGRTANEDEILPITAWFGTVHSG